MSCLSPLQQSNFASNPQCIKSNKFNLMTSTSIDLEKLQEPEQMENSKNSFPQYLDESEEDESKMEEDENIEPKRYKANTFSSGYISAHVPQELKKSRFGGCFLLPISSSLQKIRSNTNIEFNLSKEDSTDESANVTPIVSCSEFAKKRSQFFKTFKPESLKLITTNQSQTNISINNSNGSEKNLKKEAFSQKFELLEKIGEGCHSIVKKCYKKDDSPLQRYAAKIIAYKDPEYLFEILQEERVLSLLNHKNIVKYDSFYLEKEAKKAYIIAEYASGKPLAHYINKFLSVQKIRGIAKQTLKGIFHMHSKGIIHRDLSFNNIMYDEQLEQIKIIDFTVSKIVTIQKLLTNTGTLHFKAPEMLSGKMYSHSIDLWALGVNIYSLLFGSLPFFDSEDNIVTITKNILNDDPLESVRESLLKSDPLLFDFLDSLLQKNPLHRMSAREALQHPWLNQKISTEDFKVKQIRSRNKSLSASTAIELDDLEELSSVEGQFSVQTLTNLRDN